MPRAPRKVFTGKYVLKNVKGEDVKEEDYFYSDGSEQEKKAGTLVPPYFNLSCGLPVDREDLLEVFNKIFKPEDNFLFYKTKDKEVYVVIIPIKYANIGIEMGSMSGDCQKHSISFIMEGSVNVETLKLKLKRVASYLGYGKD